MTTNWPHSNYITVKLNFSNTGTNRNPANIIYSQSRILAEFVKKIAGFRSDPEPHFGTTV